MPHDLVVLGELAHGRAILEQQAVGIAEVNRAAPLVVDHRRHVDAAADQRFAFGLEFLHVVAPEGEVIESARQALRAVDVGRPLLRDARHLLRAHERDQRAVAGVEEDMLDASALGWLDDVGPRDLPAELGGVELDGPIEVEGREAEVMHAGALHGDAPSEREFRPLVTHLPCNRRSGKTTVHHRAVSRRGSACA